jgi:hypothetical protein
MDHVRAHLAAVHRNYADAFERLIRQAAEEVER